MADTVHLKRTDEKGFSLITKEPWDVFFEGSSSFPTNRSWAASASQPELESRGLIAVLYILQTRTWSFSCCAGSKALARQRKPRHEKAAALVSAPVPEAQTKGDIVGLSAVADV